MRRQCVQSGERYSARVRGQCRREGGAVRWEAVRGSGHLIAATRCEVHATNTLAVRTDHNNLTLEAKFYINGNQSLRGCNP